MTKNESKFLIDNLSKNYIVLEWGSGDSTVEIGRIVKEVYSIEHVKKWYNKIKKRVTLNVKIFLCPVTMKDKYIDGDSNEFKEYIEKPLKFDKKFDLILIDGRARYECGKIAHKLANKNTKVFIHDFTIPPKLTRESYNKLLEDFDIVEHVERLVLLKKK